MTGSPPKLLLIDGFHTAFRAFYALPGLATSEGLPTNAIHGFLQIVRKLLREQQPALAAVAWDVSDRTFRNDRFADYKAQRAPMPEELRVQIPYLRRAIEAMKLPLLELEQYEADDVMGTIAKKAAEAGYEVVLVSADKDLLQLVGPRVRLFHTGRNRLYGPEEVAEDYGLRPDQIPDFLALVGDSIDNLPGVPGIGEKGARKLLAEYGDLDTLLASTDRIDRKAYREGLIQNADRARLSRELATIHTDLPLEFAPESLRVSDPDPVALADLARQLELRTLLQELAPSLAPAPGDRRPLRSVADPEAWRAAFFSNAGQLHVAWLGTLGVEGLALGSPQGAGFWIDLRVDSLRTLFAQDLAGLLERTSATVHGHDLKEILRLCPDVRPAATLIDLLLLAYLLEPVSPHPSLEELARDRLDRELPRTPAGPLSSWRIDEIEAALAPRLEATRDLAPVLLEQLRSQPDLERLYRELEAPLMPVLVRMEEAGILIDIPLLRGLSDELGEELGRIEARAYELAGERFNLNSPQQLGVVLFERLGLPTGRKTRKKKSWSTDAETLQELARQGHELPQVLLRYREVAKLKSTYVDALPALAGPDGRIHTRFQQAVAATGRISSTQPNLQNIPVRTELGQRIRRAFRAPEGSVLLAADYSQIELRILAHMAHDEQLLEAFRKGEDIHRTTAALVFQVPAEEVSADQRRAAKTINFGLIYGMSPFGLSQALAVPQEEAERFIQAYFARFGGVQAFMRDTLARAETERRVTTLFGRIRPLPELESPSFAVRENARRIAINAPIQGTAADILKRAMIRVDERLARGRLQARLLLTVHDELVFEVPEEELQDVERIVRESMEGAAQLDVPLLVEIASGRNWAEAKG